MIPRYQRIVFWSLIGCIVIMAIFLFAEHQSARNKLNSLSDNTPIDAPYTVSENITLTLANDADGKLTNAERQLALPSETTARARALIEHLIAEYASPGSAHPLPSSAVVDEIFLVALPITGHTVDASAASFNGVETSTLPVRSTDSNDLQPTSPGGELAVINLRGTFANSHPSGVEVERLTLLSILGTLHANLPQIEQVRFLVDGQPRETLAGHIDLLRTYPTRDTTQPAPAKP